jgi:hypothetical protein
VLVAQVCAVLRLVAIGGSDASVGASRAICIKPAESAGSCVFARIEIF